MKKILLLCLSFLFAFLGSFCQDDDRIRIADSISAEGRRLYESEMCSWYGTDVFMEKFKAEAENIQGYFSYKDNDAYRCVFFSKGEKPMTLGTITFRSSYDPKTAETDGTRRPLTEKEMEYYTIRQATMDEINTDTALFLHYNGTNFNLVPLVDGETKKVYVLTGTSRSDIVIIGNDYLLTFDKTNKLLSKKRLHANIIGMKTKQEDPGEGKTAMGNVHNHIPETGDYMTATDVCTFLLFARFTNWKQQMVISGKYMSIWNCETENLLIVPTGR